MNILIFVFLAHQNLQNVVWRFSLHRDAVDLNDLVPHGYKARSGKKTKKQSNVAILLANHTK